MFFVNYTRSLSTKKGAKRSESSEGASNKMEPFQVFEMAPAPPIIWRELFHGPSSTERHCNFVLWLLLVQ